ncbi:XYLT2 [Branchiostoma lanceolatum]|uniref:protein xylosyltransferase n=1 Tax=Branchiostoma lanceolatum TaxID=7740 RepID=A0A8J9ZN44_BRALA|nr:XYLT2 [Branchiostoma lanceolatum]
MALTSWLLALVIVTSATVTLSSGAEESPRDPQGDTASPLSGGLTSQGRHGKELSSRGHHGQEHSSGGQHRQELTRGGQHGQGIKTDAWQGRWTRNAYRLREITYFKPPTLNTSFAVETKTPENKWAFLLCSRGFFISNLSVRFGSGVRLPSDRTGGRWYDLSHLPIYITGNSDGILRDKDGMYRAQHSPIPRYHPVGTACDPVLRCLGHQACILKPTLKLCGFDPQPGNKKLLDVKYVCAADAMMDRLTYEGHQRKRAEEVLYISVTEMVNGSDVIQWNTEAENDIFSLTCPGPKQSGFERYHGVCDGSPPPPEQVVNDLWKVIGRVSSEACREEVLQVYCAYHYNKHGSCVPPVLTNTSQVYRDGAMLYSDIVLPRKGNRPDERKHKEVLAHPHVSLIPARIAFVLLVHNNQEAVVQLLDSIHREYFYYAIHVDKSTPLVRQRLVNLLKEKFYHAENIRVLPDQRSFTSSWGSYNILRAELEATEEVLRMGSWDFVINLSGSDLALRDVDDIAAVLAAYRGRNFLRVIGRWKDRGIKKTQLTAWYSCGGHVYNVTRRGEPPAVADIHSASQWAVLSRDFAEFAVSNKSRDKNINGLQFFLQTTSIPDEKYLASILMSSLQFRETLIPEHLHRIAPFQGKDPLGFCRHSDETDMCGKGPRTYGEKDVPSLLHASRRFMFARKFEGEPEDPARRAVLRWQRGMFYLDLQHQAGVSDALLRSLAQSACQHFHGDGNSQVCSSVSVLSWRVLPRLVPDKSSCCMKTSKHSSSRYWIDFSTDAATWVHMRTSLVYTPRGTCFDRGHLKYVEVTTSQWQNNRHVYTVLPELEEAGATTVYLRLHAQATKQAAETGTCTLNQAYKGKGMGTTFARFDSKKRGYWKDSKNTILQFSFRLLNPQGEEHCRKLTAFLWNPPKARRDQVPEMWLQDKLVCGPLGPGKWTVRLEQLDVPHPYPYEASLHVVSNVTLNRAGSAFNRDIWQVEDVMEITNHINTTSKKSRPLSQATIHSTISENQALSVPVRKTRRMFFWLSVRLRTVHITGQLFAAHSGAAIVMILLVLVMSYQSRRKRKYRKLLNVTRVLLLLFIITLVLRIIINNSLTTLERWY